VLENVGGVESLSASQIKTALPSKPSQATLSIQTPEQCLPHDNKVISIWVNYFADN
jgi:hypothetical protein